MVMLDSTATTTTTMSSSSSTLFRESISDELGQIWRNLCRRGRNLCRRGRENAFADGNAFTGSESPLIPIPSPPPPPPFKMPDWKFIVQGDYVRIKSTNSSQSGSLDLDYIGLPSNKGPSRSTSLKSETDSGDSAPPLFCPSPDVNTKVDTFIARFRVGLKLEKINSIKEKQEMGLSNLGPD